MEFIFGDCRNHLEPKDCALVLTDPPYGIDVKLRNQSKSQPTTKLVGDGDNRVAEHVLDWCEKYSLPTCVFASPKNPWRGKWRSLLVWDKGGGTGMGDLKRSWKPNWELIQVARNGVLSGKRETSILRYPVKRKDTYLHPTAKPIALLVYLIEKLTRPGDLVFDPFAGIASTGVACAITGRRFRGVEIEPNFYQIGRKRLDEQASCRGDG